MVNPSVVVQSLLGTTFAVPLDFDDCPVQSGYAWQPFTINNNLVRLSTEECGINLNRFANLTQSRLWYTYETQSVSTTIPMLSYVEFDSNGGDHFKTGLADCTVDFVANQHVLPGGFGLLSLNAKDGSIKWQQETSGTIGNNCVVSAMQLKAALGYHLDRNAPVVIFPEEEWHAFVSLIFVFLGIVYLLGDIEILGSENENSISELRNGSKQWKKFFVLDGPLTALATCASIVAAEVTSYSESWVVGQQIFLLVAVVVNFAVLVFYLYLDPRETTRLKDLRMYVDVPIFIAILVPVMHASGNLLELGCIVANVVTTYVSQRHFFDIYRVTDKTITVSSFVHYAVAAFNIFFLAPVILLTIVHTNVGNIGVRLIVAEAITIGSLAVFG